MPDDLPDLLHPGVVMMVMIVIVVMIMVVIVVMIVMMIMVVVVIMIVVVMMVMIVLMQVPVQILHVVIMSVVLFVQNDIEVTTVYACLFHPADPDIKPVSGDSLQHAQELVLVRAKVQKRRDGHIAADACPAFQVQDSIVIIHSYLHRQGG
jgi:energy-coupling factor transporter transmembrane protein EcfT